MFNKKIMEDDKLREIKNIMQHAVLGSMVFLGLEVKYPDIDLIDIFRDALSQTPTVETNRYQPVNVPELFILSFKAD